MGYALAGLSPFDRIGSEDDREATAMNDRTVQIVTASEIDQLQRIGSLQGIMPTDGVRVALAPAA